MPGNITWGTSILLDAVGEVGGAGECGGVGEGVGGEGPLGATGEGGDDGLAVGAHEGAGEPDGRSRGVVFIAGDDGGQVADWVSFPLPMLLAEAEMARRAMTNKIIYYMDGYSD